MLNRRLRRFRRFYRIGMALRGIKVVELAGLAPGPFCGAILADFGASVVRVDKVGTQSTIDCLANGKKSISLDLKHRKGVEVFRRLCKTSDVLIETYRAGVMESLGVGPDVLLKDNSSLIYARLSGYGQYGSFSQRAGHDINYVALSGLLSMFGRSNEKPFTPINALADFGGGGLMCAFGITMALLERTKSGKGQVVDCNMVEGTSYIGSWLYRSQIYPFWGKERGKNMLDSGAHFYEVYETKDGKFVAVGAIEPKFYKNLIDALGFTEEEAPHFQDFEQTKEKFKRKFLEKTQDEWSKMFCTLDACVTPVLSLDEAPKHPHNSERKSFVPCYDQENLVPAPAPRLSRTPAQSQAPKKQLMAAEHTEQILKSLKYSTKEISSLEEEGAVEILRLNKL